MVYGYLRILKIELLHEEHDHSLDYTNVGRVESSAKYTQLYMVHNYLKQTALRHSHKHLYYNCSINDTFRWWHRYIDQWWCLNSPYLTIYVIKLILMLKPWLRLLSFTVSWILLSCHFVSNCYLSSIMRGYELVRFTSRSAVARAPASTVGLRRPCGSVRRRRRPRRRRLTFFN